MSDLAAIRAQFVALQKEIEQAELKEQRQAEEDQKKAEQEAKECEEEKARNRVAMDLQRRAQLDVMLHEKETEWTQARNRKLTEKAEAGKKRERPESDSEEDEIIVGDVFEKDGVIWQTANGRVCTHCMRVHQNCFWWGMKRARACYACSRAKRTCSI